MQTRSGIFFAAALAMVVLMMTGCKKNKKDQKPKTIIPEVLDFRGPKEVTASGLEPLEYRVAYRSGSKYKFTPVGYGADIAVPDTAYPNVVMVTWHQSSVDTAAWLVCVETSVSGLTSDPDSLRIILKKFCPWSIDDFTGTWTGSETGDCDTSLVLSIVHDPADGDNVIRVKAVADTNSAGGVYSPPFMSRLFDAWGERFIPGQGNEGDVLLHLSLIDDKVLVENDYWGETLPGENHYWTGGKGTWCGCNDSLKISFELYWSTDFSKPNKTSTLRLRKKETEK